MLFFVAQNGKMGPHLLTLLCTCGEVLLVRGHEEALFSDMKPLVGTLGAFEHCGTMQTNKAWLAKVKFTEKNQKTCAEHIFEKW